MSTITRMDAPTFSQKSQVRNDPRVKRALQRLKIDLADQPARFLDEPPTIEAITNALWLWIARQEPAVASAFLAERFAELEAFLRARQSPEVAPKGKAEIRSARGKRPPREESA